VGVLALKVLPAKRGDYRLAVVVSKKVHKSAVVRNRIRRRLYETVRNIKKDSGGKWPCDMVLTCYDQQVAVLPAGELQDNVEKLLKKAKITTAKDS
jgi:ribonuclease P protein component